MPKIYPYRTSFTHNGKRYYVWADSEADLRYKTAQKMAELMQHDPVTGGQMTVRAWTERAIDTYKTNQKEITRTKYVNRVNHCILADIGSMRLQDVKPLHCQRCLNRQNGMSKTQINEVYNALRFIFRTAVANDLIRKNPAEHIQKPNGTHVPRRALTDEERETVRIVADLKPKYKLFLLILDCGCRPSEAAEAMGKDIVYRNGVPFLHIRGTKTANSDRTVPIPPSLYERIKDTPKGAYIAEYKGGGKITDANRWRVWQSMKRDMNIQLGAKMYRNQLQEDLIAPDLVPYCMRHDYCTRLAKAKVDIRTAQKLMGHSSIELTASIYTHVDNDDIMEAATLMGCTPGCTPKPTFNHQKSPF